jgi:hypothetical protein
MRKRSVVRPLLTVAAAAVSLTACSSGAHFTMADETAPVANAPTSSGSTETVPPGAVNAVLVTPLLTPRLLPNGSPACGNVAMRAPRPADCDRR